MRWQVEDRALSFSGQSPAMLREGTGKSEQQLSLLTDYLFRDLDATFLLNGGPKAGFNIILCCFSLTITTLSGRLGCTFMADWGFELMFPTS